MQPTLTDTSIDTRKRKWAKTVIYSLLTLVVATASAAAGYYFAPQDMPAAKSNGKNVISNKNNSPSFHAVVSEGYPFDTDKKIVVKLGVPNELQAIRYNSSIQDPGLADGLLGDKFNGEMGRWKLGRPTVNDNNLDDISLVNIEAQWLKTNTSGNEDFILRTAPDTLPIPSPNMTAIQKQAFLLQLKSETEQCITNRKTGFVMAKYINICVAPYQIKQAVGSYSPNVSLKGYGVIDGLHFVLAGSLELRDDKIYTHEQETTLQEAFKPDNLPKDTEDVLTRYITALKETVILSEKR